MKFNGKIAKKDEKMKTVIKQDQIVFYMLDGLGGIAICACWFIIMVIFDRDSTHELNLSTPVFACYRDLKDPYFVIGVYQIDFPSIAAVL